MPKTYYWLKLKSDFFTSRVEIKKLWKQAGGDKYIIIYLRLLLLSMPSDGYIYYEGVEKDLASELALLLDLYPDDAAFVVAYLLKTGLMLKISDSEYFLPQSIEMMGKESDAAERMRRMRDKNQKTSQCYNEVTQIPDKTQEKRNIVTQRREEIEKELDIDKDIEKEKDKSIENNISPPAKEPRHKYGTYNNVFLSDTDLEKLKTEFPDWQERIERLSEYIASTGKSYKNHLATIRSWARKDSNRQAVKSYGTRTAAEKNKGFCFNQNEDSLDDLF